MQIDAMLGGHYTYCNSYLVGYHLRALSLSGTIVICIPIVVLSNWPQL